MQLVTVHRVALGATLGLLVLGLGRPGYAAQTDAQLISDSRQTMALFRQKDPSIEQFARRSAAYVVFPSIGKGGLGIGAAHGTGILFEGGAPIGKVSMDQVSVGAQVGGQEFSQIVFYETEKDVHALKMGKASLAGNVSAVALRDGAAANAKWKNGIAVFTATKGGLMLEASVGGQNFSYAAF